MNRRKILILTYYWPPASGPAVNRILSWVKHLTEQKHEVHILTVANPNNLAEDEQLVREIPDGVLVHKSKTFEPFPIYKLLGGQKKTKVTVGLPKGKGSTFSKIALWLRLNLFIPDPRIGWKYTAIRAGTKLVRDHNIDILISSSPPHSTQVIAASICKKTKVKWYADLRDPWTKLYHYDHPLKSIQAKRKERRIEKRILAQADHVLTVGQKLAEDFDSIASSTSVIYNGYPQKDYHLKKINSSHFRIGYIGNVSANETDHELWPALNSILNNGKYSNLQLSFTGKTDQSLHQKISHFNLREIVQLNGYQSHQFALNEITNSDLLVLIIPFAKENKYIITSKIFEYLNSHNPILGIGPIEGEAAEILNSTSYCKMFEYSDKTGIENFIENVYQNRPKPSQSDKDFILQFSRKKQAQILENLLLNG